MKPPVAAPDVCAPEAAAVDAAALNASHKSLADMIRLGDGAQARLRYVQCEFQAAQQRKGDLVTSGRELRGRLEDYQSQAGVWQAAYAKLGQHLTDYYEHCVGEPVDDEHYRACRQESDALDAERKALDDLGRPLQQRSQELGAATRRYAAEVQAAQQNYDQRRLDDEEARETYVHWLNQAMQLMVSSDFAPYADINGCPRLMEIPPDPDALPGLGESILSCFRKAGGAGAASP